MSVRKFSAYDDDPLTFDIDDTEQEENWPPAMSVATTASSLDEVYVPKYPGLQEFSQKYGNIHGYIAAVVCIFGVIANLANIVVLTRRKMITPTNVILMWLAVADLLTMAIFLPFSIHFYVLRDRRLRFPSTQSIGWIRFLVFNVNFVVLCHTVAIWLTIALAIFRYICVCYPTRGSALCSLQRAKFTVLAIYVTSTIVCIPNYMVAVVVKKNYSDISGAGLENGLESSTERTTANLSDMDQFSYYTVVDRDSKFLVDFNYWIHAFLFKLVPCALLTALTVMLIVAMHQANVRRMKLKSQGRQDESERAREHNRTTAMLLAVVGLFQLTELPQGVLTLCSIFIPNFFMDVYWPLGDLLDITALLNNSINFVLYCTMSRQFRETFVETFLGKSCQGNAASGGATQSVRGSMSTRGRIDSKSGPTTKWLKLESVVADPSSPLITATKPTASSGEGQV